MIYTVPFVSNTPDDLHCLQAAYAMIRGYFEPEREIPWHEWTELTGFVAGKGSWSMQGQLWFVEHGYEVHHLTSFDYVRMVAEGSSYLVEALGEEAGKFELELTDMPREQIWAQRMIEAGIWEKRVPTLEDIVNYLDDGFLVKCITNLNALNGKPGYLGHAVVVKGYTSNGLVMHDPGLPPNPDRLVGFEEFRLAWEDPTKKAEKLDAIRLK